MSRVRSLSVGPRTLIADNAMYGYYGKQKGIITPDNISQR